MRWVGRASRKGILEKGNGDCNGSCIPGDGDPQIKGVDVIQCIGACCKYSCRCGNAVSGV